MEYISIAIKDSSWNEVVDYLNSGKKDTKLYGELEKLNNIRQKVHKLGKHTWAKNCLVPNMDNYVQKAEDYNARTQGVIDIDDIKEYTEDVNKAVYETLTKLENDIKSHMQKHYSLSTAYAQVVNFGLPNMFDQESVTRSLKAGLNQNLFANKITANNVVDMYFDLVDLQYCLMRLKPLGPNDDVDKMLKLIHYTKAQLKQIVDDFGCGIYIDHDRQNVTLEQRKDKGGNKRFAYTPAAEYWGL